ncbi:cytochrome P450 [Rhodocollybia butyracea]|uniref:Cytochrome P450 n=1 Tax=Rhodocollybia butyracea TaxID=206335 RepID=A0A9P5QAQ8_9AGAR|nr:cytochrome P450 [Rhodocollybia butyracea]
MYYLLFLYSAFSCLFVLAIYRLFFHPLHRYPGPILAALTDWYEVYYDIVKGGGLLAKYEQLHQLHGPVIRVGPNTLHFNYTKAYHDIYTYGSTLVKHSVFYDALGVHAPESSLIFSDPEVAKGFITATVLPPSSDLPRVHDSTKANILDSFDFSHPILQGLKEAQLKIWFQLHFPFFVTFALNAPQKLILWLLPEFESYLKMKAGFERQIDSLMNNPDTLSMVEHETVFHHLLEPKDQKHLSRASLVDEAFLLVAAGGDTTANACNIGTFYALKYPHIHRKLKEELEEVWVDKDRPMTYTALEKLPYLTAFIKEALRLSIGVVHPLPRVVGLSTPEIGGLKIPAGTIVGMSVKLLHMNPDVFPDPYTFNPDRWLDQDTNQRMLDLAPFSKGPRMCLAWCELYLIFGNILRRLDLKLLITEDMIESFAGNCEDYFLPRWDKEYRVFVQNTA